jgi:tetratricopeptide (TPR) repeat protein
MGEMHISTAETYEDLALSYLQQELAESVMKAFTKAINIRQKVLGEGHPSTKEVMSCLALIKCETDAKALNEQGLAMNLKGDSEKALQLFQQALDVYKEAYAVRPNMAERRSRIATRWHCCQCRSPQDSSKHIWDDHPDTKGRMEVHRSLLKRLLENRS